MDSSLALFSSSRYHSHWDGALHPAICQQPVSGLVFGLMTYDDLVLHDDGALNIVGIPDLGRAVVGGRTRLGFSNHSGFYNSMATIQH